MDSFFELDIFYPRNGNCRYLLHFHHPYKTFIIMGSLAGKFVCPYYNPEGTHYHF